MSRTSPTQRALAECRRRGWEVGVVEQTVPYSFIKRDFLSVIDLIAIVPPDWDAITPSYIIGIQVTSGSNHSARIAKINAEPRAKLWVGAGAELAVWSYAKRGARGKRKQWVLREERWTP